MKESLLFVAYERVFWCSYIFWTTTAASIALLMHAPILHAQGVIPVDRSEANKLKPVEIPCIPPLHPLEFIASLQRRSHVMHQLLVECSKHIVEASGILVNSLYELESSVFDALHEHYQVGTKFSKVCSISMVIFIFQLMHFQAIIVVTTPTMIVLLSI